MDVGLLIDLGETESKKPKESKKERRSFYALPKTLSEEDDTFGVLSKSGVSKISAASTSSRIESSVNTGLLVQIESSQSGSSDSTQISGFSSRLQSTQNHISRGFSLTSSITSNGPSVSSLTDSRYFDNISRISNAENPSGISLISNDDVFGSEKKDIDKPPDWEMIMNEAQLLALTINKDNPSKTPHQLAQPEGLFGNFSPCEGLDSPLFDITKERPPEDFLLPLSPAKSPIKDLTAEMTAISQGSENSTKSTVGSVSQSEEDLGITEIDGVEPLALQETPKKAGGKRIAGLNQKENINPSKPRQLVPKVNVIGMKNKLKTNSGTTGSKLPSSGDSVLQAVPSEETVEKVKNKIQRSNVMRTSMTNPSIDINKLKLDESSKRQGSEPGVKKSTPMRPLHNKFSLSSNKPADSSLKPLGPKQYQNVKSKVQTGKSMPVVKDALGKGAALEKKGPSKVGMLSAKKVGNSVKPVIPPSSVSASKKPVTAIRPVGRPTLERQGSGLARPISTTNSSKVATPARARQSLAFSTPGTQLPTPSSRLAMSTKLTTPRSAISTPKAKSSLRFSALPSPQVNKGNASMISSTPAFPNPRTLNSNSSLISSTPAIPKPKVPTRGLPSPIGVKRRAN